MLTLNNRYVKLAVQEVIDMKRTKLDERVLPDYTRGEEIFNMVTHIVGAAFGVAALVLCIPLFNDTMRLTFIYCIKECCLISP